VFNSIHSPVSDLDDLVQGYERRLQGGQFDQQLYGSHVTLLQFVNLLATS